MSYEVEYLGGHPQWDSPRKANVTVNKAIGTLIIEPRGFLATGVTIRIKKEDILGVSFEKGGHRSIGKAAAGALIGGVLTGGVGLLLGGALGAHRKNLSELYIDLQYNGKNFNLVLKTGKSTEKIYAEINGLFA